jgi:hypothetical protein
MRKGAASVNDLPADFPADLLAGPPKGLRKAAVRKAPVPQAEGHCACGAVRLAIYVPARWAWHDHSALSRRAQGCAYATYVGSWKSRFRFVEGEQHVTRYEDPETRAVRSFCSRCGTPLAYERAHAPQMINIPRALFTGRTGREPLYHLGLDEQAEWMYRGEKLVPLKGFPGVMWERPRRRKRREGEGIF